MKLEKGMCYGEVLANGNGTYISKQVVHYLWNSDGGDLNLRKGKGCSLRKRCGRKKYVNDRI